MHHDLTWAISQKNFGELNNVRSGCIFLILMAKTGKKQHDFKLNLKNDGKASCSHIQYYKYITTPLCHAQNKNKEFTIIKSHFYLRWTGTVTFPSFHKSYSINANILTDVVRNVFRFTSYLLCELNKTSQPSFFIVMVLDVHIKTVHGVPKANNHNIKLITRTHYYRKFQLSSLIYSRPRFWKKKSLKRYAQKARKRYVVTLTISLFDFCCRVKMHLW